MLKIYIVGICILIIAILANGLAAYVGLKSWYDFIGLLTKEGSAGFVQLQVLDYIWLVLVYPFILGCGYWLGIKSYGWFFSS